MLCDGSVRREEEVVKSESAEDCAANLLLSDQCRFYHNMLVSMQYPIFGCATSKNTLLRNESVRVLHAKLPDCLLST